MEKYLRPFALTFLYVLSFFLSMFAVALYIMVVEPEIYESGTDAFMRELSSYMIPSQIMNSAIALFFVWSMKMADFKKAYDFKSVDWKNAWKPIVGGLYFSYTFSSIITLLGLEVDDDYVISVRGVGMTIWGIFAFGVFMPCVVELVFRESIMRCMFNNGATKLQALLFCHYVILC